MIDIPEYKSYDVMVQRIKYAIETCGEIDDDFGNAGDEDDGNRFYWAEYKRLSIIYIVPSYINMSSCPDPGDFMCILNVVLDTLRD